MSIIQGSAHTSAGGGGYQIERSLRFNSADSAYLNRTPASASNRKTFTWSGWVKRGALSSSASYFLFAAGSFAGSTNTSIRILNDSINIYWGGTGGPQWTATAVLRDPSAWYHLVFAFDTTQATFGNRLKLYVNGVQSTVWSLQESTGLTAQNSDLYINNNQQHNLGASGTPGNYFDGYMTEVNFIDGQALTPSSFGETDSATGVWKPKAFSGTYGTNGFYLPMSAGTTWSGYFDGSNDYLEIANDAAWQYGTGDFTVECWINGTSASSFSNQYIIGRYNNSLSSHSMLQISSTTDVYWYYGNGSSYVFTYSTGFKTNTWYHLAISRSGTSLRFFVNGTQVGATETNSTNYGGTAPFRISNGHQTSATYFPGYISNVRVVKGTAVYTANFTPSTTPLTAITNTVLLTCQSSTFIDNSTNNFAITNNGGAVTQLFSPFNYDATDDQSGNGNNWQPNNLNLVTTGVGADSLVDSPTNYGTDTGAGGEVRGNYCTMNPLTVATLPTLANGNLDVSVSATGVKIAQGTYQFPSSGKWYYECTFNNASSGVNGMFIGITSPTRGPNVTRSTAGAYFFYASSSGLLSSNGTDVVTGLSAISANEVFKVAVDIDNSKVWIGRGSTWYNSSGGTTGDPAAGTNPTFSISANGFTPMSGFDASSVSLSMNFGQRAWAQTCPSGFKALCTQNLPTPTIGATSTTQANDYFNVLTYTGTGSSNAQTGVGFQPDLVWIKGRSGATDHGLYDAVRGVQKQLESNTTTAETTETTGLTAFGTDGFTVGALAQLNTSSATYVAWNWKANGAGVTNTDGTITSTVSANTTSGFSICTLTASTSAFTFGHGLGAVPKLVIFKDRNLAVDWWVSHTSLGTNSLRLNTTAAQIVGGYWGTHTTSVVSVNSPSSFGMSASPHVAYCFAEVAGYSKFGSYTGNGSTDGPFVFTNFRPRYVLLKVSSTTSSWTILDSVRGAYNVNQLGLFSDLSGAEENTVSYSVDFLSNGFKLRTSGGAININAATIIYAAFAESPFKYSLAR